MGIWLVVGILSALMASICGAHADGDIQLIKLHSYNFFIPKSWFAGRGIIAGRATDGGTSTGSWSEPQTEPIDATSLNFINLDRNAAILRDWAYPLPHAIAINTYRDTPMNWSLLRPETKKLLDLAHSQPPDADGFVRVWPDFAEPGHRPQSETFVYKNYLNKIGQPLIVFSVNSDTPLGDRYDSDVFIAVERELMLRYLFSNKKFPENAWFNLYQHTTAFVDYLQKPK